MLFSKEKHISDFTSTRRQVLKAAVAGSAWGLLAKCIPQPLLAQLAAGGKKPNILLILADDLGYSDMGCFGGEIKTPNLDALAGRGVRFTQMYNAARCCPTRASILTGLYPHQAGVGFMNQELDLPGYRGFLNDQCVTAAEALKQAGYVTLMSGKWHVGMNRPHWPCDRGFDESFAFLGPQTNYFHPGDMVRNDKPWNQIDKDFYITDAFSDQAVKFVDQYGKGDKPFFLYLAYTSPHFPLHAMSEDIKKYRQIYRAGWDKIRADRHARQIEMGLIDKSWPLSPRDGIDWDSEKNKEEFSLKMAVYAAQIDRMDQGVGRVLAKLKEVGAEDNTLIIFLSDNGGCAEEIFKSKEGANKEGSEIGTPESWRSYGKIWANVSNTPFVRYKQWVHEGGISAPMIVSWPGHTVKGGSMIREPAHIVDLMPTFLQAAGADYPARHGDNAVLPLEGTSLSPLLEGKPRKSPQAYYWEHMGNCAIRKGKWKLARVFGQRWQLFDMEADRTETNDLSDSQPEKFQELVELYNEWARRCNVTRFDKVQEAIRARNSTTRKAD